jgi:signal transduction histidine kinase
MITRLDEAFQHNRRFLADASHELRTPLTILRSEMEQLLRGTSHDQKTRLILANVLEEVERLARIVQTLFELSRLEAGRAHAEHKAFDLSKLATETSEQLCLLAEDKGLKMVCMAEQPTFVEGDRARLKQVIVNLLDNAIKYTPSGGTVTLKVNEESAAVVCEISDTGMGIPEAALPHIFDRFFRVDNARSRDAGGAGIGLSIVKIICAAHGGSVEVESVENQGSRFLVKLPSTRAVTA